MAEIKIEQKKPIWPWLLIGLVLVALLVYFLGFYNSGKNTEVLTNDDYINNTKESDILIEKEYNSIVASYVKFIDVGNNKMSLDHEFTNEALLKLVDATNAIAIEVGYEVREDIEKVNEYANMITEDPFETTHAGNIRSATDILTNVLQNIQKAKFPSLADEVEVLRSASESINPKVLTLNQKDAVKNYFAKASDLLKKMN